MWCNWILLCAWWFIIIIMNLKMRNSHNKNNKYELNWTCKT